MANYEWHEITVDLKGKHQLHMRPAQRIVQTSSKYRLTEVRAVKDKTDFNAKSILDMTELPGRMLPYTEKGDYSFTFKARGPDAEVVLKDLSALVERHFDMEDD